MAALRVPTLLYIFPFSSNELHTLILPQHRLELNCMIMHKEDSKNSVAYIDTYYSNLGTKKVRQWKYLVIPRTWGNQMGIEMHNTW